MTRAAPIPKGPKMNTPKGHMLHGRYVRAFPHTRTGDQIAPLAEGYRGLLALADTAQEAVAAIKSDPNLTDQGKRNALATWAKQHAAPALNTARARVASAAQSAEGIRGLMRKVGPDKTDVAGAIVRMQTRDWLRSLEPAARTAMLAAPDLDPSVALAISEAPPALSGVTPDQAERIAKAALVATYPQEVERIEGIEEASRAVADAEGLVVKMLTKALSMTPRDLAETMGDATLADRFRAVLAQADEPIEPPDEEEPQ